MNKKTGWATMMICVLACSAILATTACTKKEEAPASNAMAEQPAPAAATPIDPATVATVSGTVKFDGTAPKAAKIDMSQDPGCKGANEAENVVVSGGNLANVFVYVKDGLGTRTFDVPKDPVVLEQQGCQYHPHVLGVMAGQTVQPPQAPAIEKNFAREEIMLPVKCNQHPWMKMYINVVKSPFYAVTGKDGKYTITGLPPGDYTIAFVQEKLGEQDQKVTVAAKESKTVDQSFKPSAD
jgi:hypothetical protein